MLDYILAGAAALVLAGLSCGAQPLRARPSGVHRLLLLAFRPRAGVASVGDVLRLALARLVLVLALVNLVIALLVNPWRDHRPSERFPGIVQDVTVIALFTAIATVLMREQLLTTSAVGAVVVGFALQDTLGNLFAGLAIQIEKPFRVGQWIALGDREGQVQEVTWRATKLRTKDGQFLIVPNSVIVEGADPQLLRAHGADAPRSRGGRQLSDAAERREARHPATPSPTLRS